MDKKETEVLKKIAFISLFFYTIFLGVLIYFSIAKFVLMLFEMEEKNAFELVSDIVEPLAHIATVGVFAWAIWTFREQKSEKQKDEAVKRASNYSVRLINYVSDNTFRLTPSTLNVVNSYLSVLRADLTHGDVHDDVKKEVFLALMVVKEFFKNLSLKDVMGYEFNGSCSEIIRELEQVYKLPEILCEIDSYLYSRIFDEGLTPGCRLQLNPPKDAIRLHQIETLISHLFFLTEEEACSDLSRPQKFTSSEKGNGIDYPALYAAYYFYTYAYVSLGATGEVEVVFDN